MTRLDFSSMWNRTIFVLPWLASFTYNNIFQFHPFCHTHFSCLFSDFSKFTYFLMPRPHAPYSCIFLFLCLLWCFSRFFNRANLSLYCTVFSLIVQFRSVQSLSHVQLFATPWIAACQASLSITNSRSSLRLTSIESVIPPSHLILCRPLLLLPSFFPTVVYVIVIWIKFTHSILIHWVLKSWCSLLSSPVWPLPIYLDSWI